MVVGLLSNPGWNRRKAPHDASYTKQVIYLFSTGLDINNLRREV
jgi:hypothetical protein